MSTKTAVRVDTYPVSYWVYRAVNGCMQLPLTADDARELLTQLQAVLGEPKPRDWDMHDDAMETLYARAKWEEKP